MPAFPEQHARQTIDAQLAAAGWVVQDLVGLNLSVARGVAVREFEKGNDFCKKVTYRASGKSEDIIKDFRTAPEKRRRLVGVLDGMSDANPARRVSRRAEPANQFRIAVTVDMIAKVTEMDLESQFRCNGSDGYLASLDRVLQVRETASLPYSHPDLYPEGASNKNSRSLN